MLRYRHGWAAAALAALFLGACSLPRGAAIQQEIVSERNNPESDFQIVPVGRDNVAQLATWPSTGWHGHYHWPSAARGPAVPVLRAGDQLALTVWDSQESSLLTAIGQRSVQIPALTVSPAGTVFVPYVEEVRVAGLTPDGARAEIQTALEAIVPSAQVQLSLTPGRASTVDVVRGVASPGSYPLPDRDYSILSLISAAGGIDARLAHPLVRLIRGGQTFEIRADRLLAEAAHDVRLRGGDKVVIEEDKRSFIALGATGRETRVVFDRDRLSTLEALALVGGLSDSRADLKGLLILRDYPASAVGAGPEKTQVVFTFDLTSATGLFAARKFPVHPDDVLIASESPVSSVRTVFGLVGSAVGLSRAVSD